MTGLAAAIAMVPSPAVLAGSFFTLTYQEKRVTLTCHPAGGGHPEASRACATLREIGGNPARLKANGAVCPMIYQPVTARLEGTWRGRTVKWERTFGNSCDMSSTTGVLFAF